MNHALGIVSFNVRGIRDALKRRTIFRHMHVKYPSHIVILQETHSSADAENRWKAEWGGDIYFAHGERTARGVCALIPRNFRGDAVWLTSEHAGRTILLKIKINQAAFLVVGIYAPTQSNDRDQLKYFNELDKNLRELDDGLPIIICGDLNVHLSVADTSNIRFRDTQACKALRGIMTDLDLIDVWRERNPDKKRFSWRRCQPMQQSRIDYFLVCKELTTSHRLSKVEIEPGVRSDHSVIVLEIIVGGGKRGPGLWRFNNTLLDNRQITDQIRSEIISAKRLEGKYNDTEDPGLLLEMLLGNIRAHCIRQSIALAKEKRGNEKRLENECKRFEDLLATSQSSAALVEEYTEVKRELDNCKSEAARRAMLFSKTKWLEKGERPTKYFLNLERKKSREKTISILDNGDGKLFTDDRDILRFCKEYYEKLHQPIDPPADQLNYMQGIQIPMLDEREK